MYSMYLCVYLFIFVLYVCVCVQFVNGCMDVVDTHNVCLF